MVVSVRSALPLLVVLLDFGVLVVDVQRWDDAVGGFTPQIVEASL